MEVRKLSKFVAKLVIDVDLNNNANGQSGLPAPAMLEVKAYLTAFLAWTALEDITAMFV